MQNFIPDKPTPPKLAVPYYEDNLKNKDVPGGYVEKPVEYYQRQITELIVKLGGMLVTFQAGTFADKPKRYGFLIHFSVNGMQGRIDCAALPLYGETEKKKDRALAQALFLVRSWLEAELYSSVYRPGAIPLVPYLIGASGRTVTEELAERGLPLLPGGGG